MVGPVVKGMLQFSRLEVAAAGLGFCHVCGHTRYTPCVSSCFSEQSLKPITQVSFNNNFPWEKSKLGSNIVGTPGVCDFKMSLKEFKYLN